jgi:hypothetical protein
MADGRNEEGVNDEVVMIPPETSTFVRILVRVLLSTVASGRIVEGLAELVAEDARFNRWFVEHAKSKVSDGALDKLLGVAEGAIEAVSSSWQQCEERPHDGAAWVELESALRTSTSQLREARVRDWSIV